MERLVATPLDTRAAWECPDESSRSVPGFHQSFVAKDGHGLARYFSADTVLLAQLGERGQASAGRELPVEDLVAELVSQAPVSRPLNHSAHTPRLWPTVSFRLRIRYGHATIAASSHFTHGVTRSVGGPLWRGGGRGSQLRGGLSAASVAICVVRPDREIRTTRSRNDEGLGVSAFRQQTTRCRTSVMARSGSKGGRPRKWPPGTPLRQVHFDVPAELADQFKAAAGARGLSMSDWLIVLGSSSIGQPCPLPVQERLPLKDVA